MIHGLEGNFNVPLLGASGSRLKLINNMTWMFSNKSKSTGQPISIIPKYTLNSTLDWHVTQKFAAQATATLYGRQKPRTLNVRSGSTTTGVNLTEVGTYAMFGLSGSYEFSKNYRLTAGIGNLLDTTIRRLGSASGSAGAAIFQVSGRNYYESPTASFCSANGAA